MKQHHKFIPMDKGYPDRCANMIDLGQGLCFREEKDHLDISQEYAAMRGRYQAVRVMQEEKEIARLVELIERYDEILSDKNYRTGPHMNYTREYMAQLMDELAVRKSILEFFR
jgi:hypothetical protein